MGGTSGGASSEVKRARLHGRDYGARVDRQKARLMWLVEDMGVDKFRQIVGEYMGGVTLRTGVHPKARPPTALARACAPVAI